VTATTAFTLGVPLRVPMSLRYAIKSVSNLHRQGNEPNIFLFATPRGGSTWVMEIIASQPGFKYYDEPFNVRRDNVMRTGLFPNWESLMPETADTERIVGYLNGLVDGQHRHMNPPPFRPHHRLLTNRIVFKIHELEHLIGTIARRCRGQVVYLLRHPVPTTLSRQVFPRLELLLRSAYYNEAIPDQSRVREIRRLGESGSHLQRGIVSWCYENVTALRQADFDGLFITYEEMVLNPVRSCGLLIERLRLGDRDAMLRAFDEPSTNINMSTDETQNMMNDADARRRRVFLVSKWQNRVTPRDLADASMILDLFGLDCYTGDALLPHRRYLHFEDTPHQLTGATADAS
jgi:hypothetical protein